MPFNETNDCTAQWQEKTWHITDNQQSPFPLSGLLQSRRHFWLHWAAGMRSGSKCWGLPSAETPKPQISLWGQWVTVLGSHLWACSERCFPQVPREQGKREHVCVRHGNVISLRCDCLWGTCGSNVTEKLHNKNQMFLLVGCSFIPYSLCFIAPVLCFCFLCLLLMSSSA